MNQAQTAVETKKALIEQLVKKNIATAAKLNGARVRCFCCIGC